MSDLLWLSDRQMAVIEPFFRWRTACRVWMIGGCFPGSCS